MKQNLTKKPVISRLFWVTGIIPTGQNRHNWPDFFCKGTFLRSWVNNLMVFEKSGLGLEKVVLK